MLLHQLVDYRPTVDTDDAPARPYSRQRTVRWELDLDAEGRFLGLLDLADSSTKATRLGRSKLVPHVGRTVAIVPVLGADDVQYVLGWVDDKSKPERVAAAHAAFVGLCRRWASEYPDDPGAQAVARFYDTTDPRAITKPEAKWSSKDLVIIVVDGRPVTDCDTLWQLWARVVEQRKSGTGDDDSGGRRGLCLVCGQPGALLNRLPQALPKALIPRAEQEVALVSANKPIHTYDFGEGLATAPICVRCGQAAVANLHAILSQREHTFTYDRQRTRLAWWVTHGGDEQTIALLDAAPDTISDFLERLHTGVRPRPPRSDQQLCSVTVSGNVARLVVHSWRPQPLETAEAAVLQWFTDHEIVHRWQDRRARFPIWRLVGCAGQWQPNDSGGGRYIALFDKAADRPDDLAHLLLHAALHGTRLPPYLLAHLVRRIRTDGHLDESRVALLRVALTRHPNPTVETPMPGLDPTNTDPAYVAGRLFAVLEATQRAAYPGEDEPNTSFFDRFFSGAVANPRIAAIQGGQLHAAWIRKIRTTAERERTPDARRKRLGVAAALKTRLDELYTLFDAAALPARITTEAQSLFIVGYHHQRAHDLAQARAGRAPEITADDQTPPESDSDNPAA